MARSRRMVVLGRVALAALGLFVVVVMALSQCERLPVVRPWLQQFRGGQPMPAYAAINRMLGLGTHPYLDLLPGAALSPALRRVERDPTARARLLSGARVKIALTPDYAHINDKEGTIVVSWWYYHLGANLDLYLDLLHELTHLRQLRDGHDLWDARHPYTERPTEVEGYAVAVEEGRRLGMDEARVLAHLNQPWLTLDEVRALVTRIDALLAASPPAAE